MKLLPVILFGLSLLVSGVALADPLELKDANLKLDVPSGFVAGAGDGTHLYTGSKKTDGGVECLIISNSGAGASVADALTTMKTAIESSQAMTVDSSNIKDINGQKVLVFDLSFTSGAASGVSYCLSVNNQLIDIIYFRSPKATGPMSSDPAAVALINSVKLIKP